jgi:GAF domain-containing protein
MPLGRLKVGSVPSNRTGLLIEDPRAEKWERPAWVESERITSFVGQPPIFRDETLGVLAVFRREPINEQEFRWLRMFGDQAASAIANARAFSELERLRQQLESHNAYRKEEVDAALAFGRIGRSRTPRLETGRRRRGHRFDCLNRWRIGYRQGTVREGNSRT